MKVDPLFPLLLFSALEIKEGKKEKWSVLYSLNRQEKAVKN